MNTEQRTYLAPETEVIAMTACQGILEASILNQGGSSWSETYDLDII